MMVKAKDKSNFDRKRNEARSPAVLQQSQIGKEKEQAEDDAAQTKKKRHMQVFTEAAPSTKDTLTMRNMQQQPTMVTQLMHR